MNFSLTKILIIILTSTLISLLYNHFNPKGLKLIKEERKILWESDSLSSIIPADTIKPTIEEIQKTTVVDSTKREIKKEPEEGFKEPKAIKIDFAYKLYKQGFKFIDARPVEEFAEGHIKGAVNIPFYGSENYESVLNKIPKDQIVVTYCNGDDCDLSILLGDELFKKGYKKVYVFFGGWNDWLEKGYPTAK